MKYNYSKLLNDYNKNGYIVLKNAMPPKQCKSLIKKTIIPILHKEGIFLNKLNNQSCNNYSEKSGELIYGKNGGHIIPKNDKNFRFPALFNSKKLNNVLNLLHSRNVSKQNWKYSNLAKDGLGWIHLRYPFYNYNYKRNDSVKCPENSFHLDGTYVHPNNRLNPKQSVVLLPFITNVGKNEGGTAVIPGSHKLINNYILRHYYKSNNNLDITIDKIVKENYSSCNIIDITGEQGDILIMHPHLVHSSSYADKSSNTRITFNLSVNSK